MPTIAFFNLPLFVRVTSLIVPFLTWVLFAELIIDRHGLDRFLPFYRVGNLCPYDLVVIAILIASWIRLHRRAG